MLEKIPLDLSRVHFVGPLPYGQYLKVIQASDIHVYLSRPFVLSWSFTEALSTGCLVLGSDTGPVREVIKDGENGLLVDFFAPKQIADRIDEALDHPNRMTDLRVKARQTILDGYDLAKLLPKHLELIKQVAERRLLVA
jgi:glycosyltransferase involved in cell wall biosynthesis